MSKCTQNGSQNSVSPYRGKAKKDIEVLLLDGLIPPDENPDEQLKKLYVQVEIWAKDAIAWYLKRKNWRKYLSLIMRFFAVVCAIVGGLIPLLMPIVTKDSVIVKYLNGFFPNMDPLVLGQIGYIFLALAAAFMTIDRIFDLSTGWMRSMNTAISLQALLAQFQMDWQISWHKKAKEDQASDSDMHEKMLQSLKFFCLRFIREIAGETETWEKKLKESLQEAEDKLNKAKRGGKNRKKQREETPDEAE